MSWIGHHRVSERLASEAQAELRAGHDERARTLYRRAADAELCAIRHLEHAKTRTLGISWVSVASLYYKAGMHDRAGELAWSGLNLYLLPEFAKQQLRNLLQSICGPAIATGVIARSLRTHQTPSSRPMSRQLTRELTTTRKWSMPSKDEYNGRIWIAIDPRQFKHTNILIELRLAGIEGVNLKAFGSPSGTKTTSSRSL